MNFFIIRKLHKIQKESLGILVDLTVLIPLITQIGTFLIHNKEKQGELFSNKQAAKEIEYF